MNINITLFGELVFYSMFIVGGLSYYLGRRKTDNPKITTLIGVILCITPPLNLAYLVGLTLKNDISPDKKTENDVWEKYTVLNFFNDLFGNVPAEKFSVEALSTVDEKTKWDEISEMEIPSADKINLVKAQEIPVDAPCSGPGSYTELFTPSFFCIVINRLHSLFPVLFSPLYTIRYPA